jgi:NRAMP (natural resistance-associated macrophage protein)-like metal ion transporter
MASHPVPPSNDDSIHIDAVRHAKNALRDTALVKRDRRRHDPHLEDRWRKGSPKEASHGVFRSIGLGLITGAADDDPAAIGAYAAAGAKLGPSFLWAAPFTVPMMFALVYLSSKIGQVSGRGLFAVIREYYPRWLLYVFLVGILIGNTIEAGADIGGMAAAVGLLVPIPIGWIVIPAGLSVLALQIWGSYALILNIFRWLALALLAYVASAILAKPDLWPVIRGSLIPTFHWNREYLSILVAVMGATLSGYLFTWQSNQDVEEDISMGRRRLVDRIGTTKGELRYAAHDIAFGMFFSNLVMYFIILSTAATLFKAGHTDINTAADAAQALRPFAGKAAGVLFAIGVIAVGFLAVPVMTTGAAYDLCQTFGWKHGLHAKLHEARGFYASITVVTLIAMAMNFFGINPMKALVWAGIVQGFSSPFLMLTVMLITNNRLIMGRWVNRRTINVFGWVTTAAMFAAVISLVVMWIV